jgi:pyruvate carboxylase
MFGDLVKVTPSSKVVGDMAMFMTANGLTREDILQRGETLAFPDSVRALFRGDLGQPEGGFPKALQRIILKGELPYTERPNAHLAPIDFEKAFEEFRAEFGQYVTELDLLSYILYPKVFREYNEHVKEFGDAQNIPTTAFFYGLKPNEEIMMGIEDGKKVIVQYLNMTEPNAAGQRVVFFRLNGQMRSIIIKDKSIKVDKAAHSKATKANEVGTPLQGNLSKILVKEGDTVAINTPLFIIEAMKMESTITSPMAGKVAKIHLSERTLVEQDDLVIELA